VIALFFAERVIISSRRGHHNAGFARALTLVRREEQKKNACETRDLLCNIDTATRTIQIHPSSGGSHTEERGWRGKGKRPANGERENNREKVGLVPRLYAYAITRESRRNPSSTVSALSGHKLQRIQNSCRKFMRMESYPENQSPISIH